MIERLPRTVDHAAISQRLRTHEQRMKPFKSRTVRPGSGAGFTEAQQQMALAISHPANLKRSPT